MRYIFLLIILLFLPLGLVSVVKYWSPGPATESKLPLSSISITPSPQIIAKDIEMTGWIAAWDTGALKSLGYTVDYLKTFSPMLYQVSQTSELEKISTVDRDQLLSLARQNDLPILPVITDGSDPKRINELLYTDDTKEEFINQLLEEAEKEDFDGWSIDIESLEGKDQEAFTQFIQELSESLHENDLKLNVIVFGREEKEAYDPATAHNYQQLARYADQIQLMVYNYNNEFTAPGGQSPLYWYKSVLSYARKTIPEDKIVVGLSANGFDWGQTGRPKGLTFSEVHKIISDKKLSVSYNASESAAIIHYQQNNRPHVVWFENANTIFEKIQIARNDFGINKFALWWIGTEDPEIWKKIEETKSNSLWNR